MWEPGQQGCVTFIVLLHRRPSLEATALPQVRGCKTNDRRVARPELGIPQGRPQLQGALRAFPWILIQGAEKGEETPQLPSMENLYNNNSLSCHWSLALGTLTKTKVNRPQASTPPLYQSCCRIHLCVFDVLRGNFTAFMLTLLVWHHEE